MDDSLQVTALQLAILRILWRRGEATVAEVHHELLPERGLALTTVATTLARLAKRRVLTRATRGRHFVYAAAVSEEQVRRAMVRELTELLFEGDAAALVAHLVETRQLSPGELRALGERMDGADPAARG